MKKLTHAEIELRKALENFSRIMDRLKEAEEVGVMTWPGTEADMHAQAEQYKSGLITEARAALAVVGPLAEVVARKKTERREIAQRTNAKRQMVSEAVARRIRTSFQNKSKNRWAKKTLLYSAVAADCDCSPSLVRKIINSK